MSSHPDDRSALPSEPPVTPTTGTLHVPGVHALLDVRLRTSAAGRDLSRADYLDALDRLHEALLFAAIRPDLWPHVENLPPEEEQRCQAARCFLAEAGIPVLDS